MGVNIFVGVGNLATEPSMKATKGGTEMCTFRLAVNSGFGDRKETAFLHIITFGKTAVNCERYLSKGRKVLVRGRISTGSYEKSDGTKVYTTDIMADEVEFLSGDVQQRSEPKEEPKPEEQQMPRGFAELDDGSLPF